MKRIVLVGGGSGGHFYPLIAVAEKLNQFKQGGMPIELFYFGPDPYDNQELTNNEITFIHCPAGKKRKYFSILNFFDSFLVVCGFFVAVYKLYCIYPDVIFCKGGYTSVPVTLAGFFLRIPIVVHESDTKPGSANKLAGRFARYIAISFNEVGEFFPTKKIALTGIPQRQIFTQKFTNAIAELGLPQNKPLLFVTGGSLGAQRLNNLILESLDELLPYFVILHQTGAAQETIVKQTAASLIADSSLLESYFVKGSLTGKEMSLAESAAVLIISRAGAGSIFEIAAKGKPAILIPIPEAVSHDQKTNAYAYARFGAASVIEEANFTDGLLASEINRIMSDAETYTKMSNAAKAFAQPDAAEKIAQTLLGIAQEHA